MKDFRRKHGDAVEDAHNMLGTEKFVKEQDGINYGIDKCVSKSKSNTNISTNNSNKNNIFILRMYIQLQFMKRLKQKILMLILYYI